MRKQNVAVHPVRRRSPLRSLSTIAVCALLPVLVSCKPSSRSNAPSATAYFQLGDSSHKDIFVFATDKPAIIQQARRILSGEEKTQAKVIGTIVKSEEAYNPGWSFHLDPNSVTFSQAPPEACDATTEYVSEHLDDVGTKLLPGSQWCPSTSQLIAEVSAPFPKAGVTDCFRYHPLIPGDKPGDKMELRNTCNVCKVAVIHYSYLNSGSGTPPEPKEFRVLGHASEDIDTSGTVRTDLIDQKYCKK
jgi:hypothetical protein